MTSSANISLEQLQRIRGLRKTFLKVANDNEAAREVYMHNYHAVSVGGASVEAARRSPYPGIYPAAISVRTGVHLHPDLALQVMVENHPQPYRQFVSTLQDQVGQAQQQLSVEHMQRYRKVRLAFCTDVAALTTAQGVVRCCSMV